MLCSRGRSFTARSNFLSCSWVAELDSSSALARWVITRIFELGDKSEFSSESVFSNTAENVNQAIHHSLNHPINLGGSETYGYEYLASSSTTTQTRE